MYNKDFCFLQGSFQEKGKGQHSQAQKTLAALLQKASVARSGSPCFICIVID